MVIKACLFAMITIILYGIIKPMHQTIALFLKIGCVAMLALNCFEIGSAFFRQLQEMEKVTGVSSVYIKLVMRCIGIGYICDMIAKLAREEGLGSVASQLELYGKLSMLAMAMPVVLNLLELLKQMLVR